MQLEIIGNKDLVAFNRRAYLAGHFNCQRSVRNLAILLLLKYRIVILYVRFVTLIITITTFPNLIGA